MGTIVFIQGLAKVDEGGSEGEKMERHELFSVWTVLNREEAN